MQHAAGFGWGATTERLLEVYGEACWARTGSPTGEGRTVPGVPTAVTP